MTRSLRLLLIPCFLGVHADGSEPDLATFRKNVAPIFAKYCLDCHGEDLQEADLSLAKIDPNILTGKDFETWRIIDEKLRFQDMPPKGSDPPTDAERQAALGWIRGELLKTQQPGFVADAKLLLPQFGNYVDHRALFDKRYSHVTPASPRIWRLRPDIYNALVPRLGEKVTGLSNALNSSDDPEFADFSAPYFLDEASTLQLFANAKRIASAQIAPSSKDKPLKQLATPAGSKSQDVVDGSIDTAFRKALGRGPTEAERVRFAALHAKALAASNAETAARALLTAILMKPEFLFRQELGSGTPDKHGRIRLTERELAYALSYALADLPIKEFVAAADAGKLATSVQIADLVRQHLSDEAHDFRKSSRVLQFFREYFHYPFATEVFKDQPEGGEHKPASLVADLELTIADILRGDRNVLGELLTTRKYYVNVAPGRKKQEGTLVIRDKKTRKYQTAFNLPLDWKWGLHLQPVEFRPDERAGVLTHPAWLAAWSGNFDNHPVQRGKWVRTHLLGGTVPDVPIGVDARVPEAEHKSFRTRLAMATNKAECWRCHQKMDPLGVVFERYDHFGRFQRLDAGQPVDATGIITRTGVPDLDGKRVTGPTELMEILAESEYVEQVFVRHAFRYFLGRNETLGDANTLQDAHKAYKDNNGSFRALVVSLLSSDSFTLRQAPPKEK